MVFDVSAFQNATAGKSGLEVMQVVGQQTHLVSLLLLVGIPLVLTFIIAAFNGSINKANFWQDFIIPELIRWLILLAVIFGFLPILTSLL